MTDLCAQWREYFYLLDMCLLGKSQDSKEHSQALFESVNKSATRGNISSSFKGEEKIELYSYFFYSTPRHVNEVFFRVKVKCWF